MKLRSTYGRHRPISFLLYAFYSRSRIVLQSIGLHVSEGNGSFTPCQPQDSPRPSFPGDGMESLAMLPYG